MIIYPSPKHILFGGQISCRSSKFLLMLLGICHPLCQMILVPDERAGNFVIFSILDIVIQKFNHLEHSNQSALQYKINFESVSGELKAVVRTKRYIFKVVRP